MYLLLFAFAAYNIEQRQTAVSAYFKSKQLLLFVFAQRSVCKYSMAEENPGAQRQTTVITYLTGEQLLLLVFVEKSAPSSTSVWFQTTFTPWKQGNGWVAEYSPTI